MEHFHASARIVILLICFGLSSVCHMPKMSCTHEL